MRVPLRLLICVAAAIVIASGAAVWAWPHTPLSAGTKADRIVLDKSARTLTLLKDGTILATYRVSLGGNPSGHKLREGDERTPEGRYEIDGRNAESRFYRSLHVSYPNAADRERARSLGVSPGGDIMIHGIKNGYGWIGRLHRLLDWTNGCIAVTDEEMRDIWSAVAIGTPIEILG